MRHTKDIYRVDSKHACVRYQMVRRNRRKFAWVASVGRAVFSPGAKPRDAQRFSALSTLWLWGCAASNGLPGVAAICMSLRRAVADARLRLTVVSFRPFVLQDRRGLSSRLYAKLCC